MPALSSLLSRCARRTALALVAAAASLGTIACEPSIETYSVDVASPDVRQGKLSLRLDPTGGESVLHAVLELVPTRSDACPVVGDDASVVLEQDGERTAFEIESRGGGFTGIRCLFKCSDLVRLEANCSPLAATLRGAAA
jgi:hypothetical protein